MTPRNIDAKMTDSEFVEQLRLEFANGGANPVSERDFERLSEECGDPPDTKRLRRYLRRRQLGEPLEYIVGYQEFRGRRFAIDKRVYITDPELTYLIDAVVESARALAASGCPNPLIVEFGVGCGSLAISIKKELPEARVIGVDLDSDAIAVALKNVMQHHADVWLLESDLFSGVSQEIVPDIIFGDPPWGDEESLYDDGRPATHYQAMPLLSAFPVGGITAVHEALLEDVARRGWQSSIFLNLGTLQEQHIERLAGLTAWHECLRYGEVSVLHCKMMA
jgi:release factor glutamine methyltransferase